MSNQESITEEPLSSQCSYIVGIGASAGGLNALEQFFDNMPAASGMAFVIIQHLSPDFKSLMDDLLSRHTSMPINRVTNGIDLKPDNIYLIPPKSRMTIMGHKLYLTEKTASQHLELPIDIFSIRWRKTWAITPSASSSQEPVPTVRAASSRSTTKAAWYNRPVAGIRAVRWHAAQCHLLRRMRLHTLP